MKIIDELQQLEGQLIDELAKDIFMRRCARDWEPSCLEIYARESIRAAEIFAKELKNAWKTRE